MDKEVGQHLRRRDRGIERKGGKEKKNERERVHVLSTMMPYLHTICFLIEQTPAS